MLLGFYAPGSLGTKPEVIYEIKSGSGYEQITKDLEMRGIVKNGWFFRIYVLISGNYSKLQAGKYSISPSMSASQIAQKFAAGDVIKNNITIIEGWKLEDIASYLESKQLATKKDFLDLTNPSASSGQAKDFTDTYDFLKDKPKNLNLEGYVFPDTYQFNGSQTLEDLLKGILGNFDKKLTVDLRKEIANQHKSIFEIITMASIIEKEVQSLVDKKMVSGILWKRQKVGVPLQVDATINYITKKSDPGVKIKDTQIDSPYNTYKYRGLPLGPISNPGMDSILAAIYPVKSDYWYYLSANGNGKTIFSRTLEDHAIARAKYLKP